MDKKLKKKNQKNRKSKKSKNNQKKVLTIVEENKFEILIKCIPGQFIKKKHRANGWRILILIVTAFIKRRKIYKKNKRDVNSRYVKYVTIKNNNKNEEIQRIYTE